MELLKKIDKKILELEKNLLDYDYLENSSDDDILSEEKMLAYLKGYRDALCENKLAYYIG
jgi:hypothetical protein